ncbi:MAG: ABC transporter permease, partial [Gemmatimonadetes bacterium]|nr:ABC transporter permease [Gemmatimonadota bacterium]
MPLSERLFLMGEGVRLAFDAIRANRVRAFLTISGIAIGVLVVVVMAAATNGIQQSFKADVDATGAATFQIRRRDIRLSGCSPTDDTCTDRRNPAISSTERAAIRRLSTVASATDMWSSSADMRYRDRNLPNVGYDAMSATWMEIDRGDIAPGRNFSSVEAQSGARVAIVNDSLKQQLFGDSDPLGKTVMIDNVAFSVIGVYRTTAGFLKSLSGRGPDKARAIIPYAAAKQSLGLWDRNALMMVKPVDGVPQSEVMDDVTATLRAMRGLRPSQINNFALITNDRLMETFDQLFGAIFLVGLALSAVGLLVGGVGVVAIMMISVTERTREIGVRKALGARRREILWQFLFEAVFLTSVGGILGVALGASIGVGVHYLTGFPVSLPWWSFALGLGFSGGVGIFFGLVPAIRASRLDPI